MLDLVRSFGSRRGGLRTCEPPRIGRRLGLQASASEASAADFFGSFRVLRDMISCCPMRGVHFTSERRALASKTRADRAPAANYPICWRMKAGDEA